VEADAKVFIEQSQVQTMPSIIMYAGTKMSVSMFYPLTKFTFKA
jgi:hypothetical protein